MTKYKPKPNVVMMHKKGICYNCGCMFQLRTVPLFFENRYVYGRFCFACYDTMHEPGGLLRRDVSTIFVSAEEFKEREMIGYLDHGVQHSMPEDFTKIGEKIE